MTFISEAQVAFFKLATSFNINFFGAADHDISDIVASEKWLKRTKAQNIIGDCLDERLLLMKRESEFLAFDDLCKNNRYLTSRCVGCKLGKFSDINGL